MQCTALRRIKKARHGEGEVTQIPSGKWIGKVPDVTEGLVSGNPKLESTKCFSSKDEDITARAALAIEMKDKKETRLHTLAQECDDPRDLPPRPLDTAEPDTACYAEATRHKEEAEGESEEDAEEEGEEGPTRGCCGHRKCYLPGTRFERCCFVAARLDHMGECDGNESPGSEWSV